MKVVIFINNSIDFEKNRSSTYNVQNVHKSQFIGRLSSRKLPKKDLYARQGKSSGFNSFVFLGHQNWNLVIN